MATSTSHGPSVKVRDHVSAQLVGHWLISNCRISGATKSNGRCMPCRLLMTPKEFCLDGVLVRPRHRRPWERLGESGGLVGWKAVRWGRQCEPVPLGIWLQNSRRLLESMASDTKGAQE